MKSLIKKTAIILLCFPIFFAGCDLLEEGDSPTRESELERLMPYSQYLISYWTGTDNSRFALQWMQQLGGVRGVHGNVDEYTLSPDYLNTVWELYYDYVFRDLSQIKNHAEESDSRAYRGIANILMAYSLGMMTDVFGDIPYENALSPSPPYDEQQKLIMEIISLLNEGVQDLSMVDESEGYKPGAEDDPIYEGNLDKWKRAANVIRLRYMLRIANESGNYGIFSDFDSKELFTGNHDDMLYHFEGGDKVNPHYYFENEFNNTRVGKHLIDMLKETEDPRLPVYAQLNINNEYVGTGPGESNSSASNLGSDLVSEKAPVRLISYTEQKFIEAEVYKRKGQQPSADLAYEEAVKSSLSYYGVADPEWEAEHATVEDVTLEQIIEAKYIALFLQQEVWADFRRTGYPELEPYDADDAPNEQIPRRYVYPGEQQMNNPTHVPDDVDIYTNVWWDVE